MGQFTFNIELDSKSDTNGFRDIYIRIHQKGHLPARLLTKVRIENAEKNWSALVAKRKGEDAKPEWGKWVINHVDRKAINTRIKAEFARIQELVQKWQEEQLKLNPELKESNYTPKEIAQLYKAGLSDDYFELLDKVLTDVKETRSYATWSLRSTAINILAQFAGNHLPLTRVTTHYVERFQDWLQHKYISDRTGEHLSAASINQYMECLNSLHIEVLRLKGHSRTKAALLSPFTDVDKLKAKSTYRAKLDEEQIEQLNAVEVEHNRRKHKPEQAFNYWVLAHLLAGMRYSDLMMLRYRYFDVDEQGNPVHLTYQMLKTGNTVSIPVFEDAQKLLKYWWKEDHHPDNYILPELDPSKSYYQYPTYDELKRAPFAARKALKHRLSYLNFRINSALKLLQEKAKLKLPLKMHNARHSFADLARRIMQEDNSINLLDITRMLGQKDPKMVLTYIEEMENQDSTKSMHNVFKRRVKQTEHNA